MTHALFQQPTYTMGDLYTAVLNIHERAEARAFYEDYVAWARKHAMDAQNRTPEGAERLARSNIGWFFGEGMPDEDVRMWVDVCGASHPVFGSMNPRPTPDQAFQAGLARGLGS